MVRMKAGQFLAERAGLGHALDEVVKSAYVEVGVCVALKSTPANWLGTKIGYHGVDGRRRLEFAHQSQFAVMAGRNLKMVSDLPLCVSSTW